MEGSPSASLAAPPPPEAQPKVDFRAVYEAEFSYVYNSLRRLGTPERDLEDLIHEVFLVFYRSNYDPARPIRPWLFGIAFRVASDWRRRAHNRYEVAEEREVADPTPGAEERMEAGEGRALLKAALDRLDLDRRAVLVLHDIDGCSMPEIAAVLDAPLNTLYSRLRLARAEITSFIRRRQEKTP